MKTVIVDYGMGNLGSILNMLKYLDIDACISSSPEIVRKAKKIILPGVGAFDNGMAQLNALNMTEVLHHKALIEKIPILGICLGMQLMTMRSEEGTSDGLCWINANTIRIRNEGNTEIKVPHVGWNCLNEINKHPLNEGIINDSRYYFVHSYAVICADSANTLSQTRHGIDFDSMIANDNLMGCQFHPEKSHRFGMKIFENFNKL